MMQMILGHHYRRTRLTHLGSEELHDRDLAIHADLFDWPQTLSSDHIDLQTCVLGNQKVQVLSRCEVTCSQTIAHTKHHWYKHSTPI